MVDVQFGLGQSGDEGVQVTRHDSGHVEMLGQEFLPERRPGRLRRFGLAGRG